MSMVPRCVQCDAQTDAYGRRWWVAAVQALHGRASGQTVMRGNGFLDGCAGKVQFRSKGAVVVHLQKRKSRVTTKSGRRRVVPYLCCVCGRWHIGSSQG